MIEEAFVRGFDDYFDRSYFIEPLQETGFGFMFKINDKREYYWNTLFPNKFYKDEEKLIDNDNLIVMQDETNNHITIDTKYFYNMTNSTLYRKVMINPHTGIIYARKFEANSIEYGKNFCKIKFNRSSLVNPNVEITKSKTMSYTWNFALDPSETQHIITLEGETFDFDK